MAKEFQGTINIDVRDSAPDWGPYAQPQAPEGAPSVLFIVLDDVGFSAMEPWGGLIETPKKIPRSITESVLGEGNAETELPAGATAASETR